MNDRELLELASKAGEIPIYAWRYNEVLDTWFGARADSEESTVYWNPLTDDGDALRLAVKLRLEVAIHETYSGVINGNLIEGIVEHNHDPYAATRRAIVRFAANIAQEQDNG